MVSDIGHKTLSVTGIVIVKEENTYGLTAFILKPITENQEFGEVKRKR